MSTILQFIPPLLTVVAIFAALRGQRVTNANAAREKLEQARNEARMVLLQPEYPDYEAGRQEGQALVVLNLEVAGPSPIVQVESVMVEPRSPGVERLLAETLRTDKVLKHDQKHEMGLLQNRHDGETLTWRVTWEDRYGYVWQNRFSFAYGAGEVELIGTPTGERPITTPSRRQQIRNTFLPYDNWAPRRRPLE